jgi:uncharacterized membrane-anchored protein YhcB (DUF1043 family)
MGHEGSVMGFLGRWFSHSIGLATALVLGVLAMQAPAFTREYAAALQQVSSDARRDIDQREASARQYYAITAEQDDELVEALKKVEPSNADTLTRSLDRARALQSADDVIMTSRPLLRPLVALRDALHDPRGYKRAIWELQFQNYAIQLDLSAAAMIYGIVGLMLGSLMAQLVLAPFYRAPGRPIYIRR